MTEHLLCPRCGEDIEIKRVLLGMAFGETSRVPRDCPGCESQLEIVIRTGEEIEMWLEDWRSDDN